ncbi:hypothetical protein A2U01_0118957, partial [Trifolium medium]|nr:hypothetical protein [Trifolium medium]
MTITLVEEGNDQKKGMTNNAFTGECETSSEISNADPLYEELVEE